MATAFEGEAVIGTDSIAVSTASGSATAYTVPASSYARVFFHRVSSASGTVSVNGIDVLVSGNTSFVAVLETGQTVSYNTNGSQTDIGAGIIEYANP